MRKIRSLILSKISELNSIFEIVSDSEVSIESFFSE